MNKILLIWNLVLTVLLAGMVFVGCTMGGTDVSAQVKANRDAIEQIVNLANSNRTAISSNSQSILANKVAFETFAASTEGMMNALQTSLQQYVQAYVSQAVK